MRWSLGACAFVAALAIVAAVRDLGPSPFHPHGYCFLWDPTLVGLYVGADLVIGLSYVAISVTLLVLARRARGLLPFSWIVVAFGLFIVSCGLTHFMDVVTLWYTAFWVSADVRVLTALASFATAVALPRAIPSVIDALRAIRQTAMRRDELERSHAALSEHASARTADLEASEERYRRLLDSTSQGVATVDSDGVITFANQRFADLVGVQRDTLQGTSVAELFSTDSAPVVEALARPCAEIEVKLSAAGGAGRWVMLSTDAAARSAGGDRLVMVTDLTRHRQLEEKLRQSQKLEAVGRLASGVAHDFNNLITAMLGYSELIGPHLAMDDRRGQIYLTEIHHAAERASALTRQLLAFSRSQMLEPREISLDDLVNNAQRMLQRVIGEDIHLVVQTGGDVIRVYADPGQLEQVLMNLVVNARHAMPEGGTLTIETGTSDVRHEQAGEGISLPPGRYASVSVSDTGTGIPPDVLPHIFEPFFTTKGDAGTGLGLATVYGIVKQSGGDIVVRTQLEVGTTVRVLLPTVAA